MRLRFRQGQLPSTHPAPGADGSLRLPLLPGDDFALVEDDEGAIQALLELHLAAGVAAAARPRRDLHPALLEMNAKMGARPWTARTQVDYARMLLARNGSGDAVRAEELLEQARATAQELGMSTLREQIRTLTREEQERR